MKKIIQSYGEHIAPVRVYLDDIQEIIGILRDSCEEVLIQTSNNQLDNVDELVSLRKDMLHDLKIYGRRPYISIDMEPNQIWLFVSEDTPESRGLFEKVKVVLLKCTRPFTWLLHSSFLNGIAWPLTILGAVLSWRMNSNLLTAFFAILFLLCVLWVVYGYYDRFNRYTVVVPRHRIDSPNFLKRNTDKIVLAIISALIGALVSYVLK